MMQSSLLRIWMHLLLALCITAGVVACKSEDDGDKKDKDKKESKKDKDDKDKDKKKKEEYVDIFNEKDLTGWDGDPRLWRVNVEDKTIVGQTTPENPAPDNTFLIWRGGTVKDFKLKLKVKIHNGNSGIQYRSQELGSGKWSVGGYQAEVSNKRDNPKIGGGFLYHERGRGDIAHIGDYVVIDTTGTRTVVGKLGDAKALEEIPYFKDGEWNDYTIVARGNHLSHVVNGYAVMEIIDNDAKNALREGLLALQIHVGEPMTVEFKDIKLMTYDDSTRKFNEDNNRDWIVAPDPQP